MGIFLCNVIIIIIFIFHKHIHYQWLETIVNYIAVEPPLTATVFTTGHFFGGRSIHWLLFKPLYNGRFFLSTRWQLGKGSTAYKYMNVSEWCTWCTYTCVLLSDTSSGGNQYFLLEQSVSTREGSLEAFEQRQSDGHTAITKNQGDDDTLRIINIVSRFSDFHLLLRLYIAFIWNSFLTKWWIKSPSQSIYISWNYV